MQQISKKELKSIIPLRAQIRRLRGKVRAGSVADTVRGSDAEDPYLLRTITVEGMTPEAKAAAWALRQCAAEYRRLLLAVESIDDPITRQAVRLYYVEGVWPWDRVAAMMGGYNSGDNLKLRVHRLLKT